MWAFRIWSYLRWRWQARSPYRLHSELIYRLARHALRQPLYEFRWLRRQWLKSIPPEERSTALRSAITTRDARRLAGLVRFFQPHQILELGTGYGFSTLVLAHANANRPLYSLDRDSHRQQVACHALNHMGLTNTHLFHRTYPDLEPQLIRHSQLVFIDGGHHSQVMKTITQQLLHHLPQQAVLVWHDIYWNRDMASFWHWVAQQPRVTFWLDLYRLGVAILDYPAAPLRLAIKPSVRAIW